MEMEDAKHTSLAELQIELSNRMSNMLVPAPVGSAYSH